MTERVDQNHSPMGRERFPRGMTDFIGLLALLLRRPGRGERRTPLFWVIRPADGTDVVGILARRLGRTTQRRVPHAVIDASAYPSMAETASLLRAVQSQLSLEAFGAERLRFRHYLLADWLMSQTLPGEDVADRRATLARRLRDRRRPQAASYAGGGGAEGLFATAYQFLYWLVRRVVPGALFRLAVSGRVPLIGRHYRWFMRQQYLAPRQSVTFLGFAERLTAGWRDGERPDQVNKLLVHAFLEDLRRDYRRRPWRLAGWRRTAYPALLLDKVVWGDAGHTLVRLINDVRNETGRGDPLLVIAASEQPAPGASHDHELIDARDGYHEWAALLPEARRLRRASAWYLTLRTGTESEVDARGRAPDFAAPGPPILARRSFVAGVCLVVLAGFAVPVASRWRSDCYPTPFAERVTVRLIEGECIGYSDSDRYIFNHDAGQDPLRTIQKRIFEQNAAVEQEWRHSDRRRPLMTLIYFGALTGQRTGVNEESYVSEREELEGMATAQYALLKESARADGSALLRVVVANGGYQMRHANEAVRMLERLAREDPTVVGVVGLVDSRTTTAEALRRLNSAGLPALAPTLSADGMEQNSKLYLQLSAPNLDQVAMVGEYADTVLHTRDVHVYYTTGEGSQLSHDLYVNTLVNDARQRFGRQLTRVEQWSTGLRLDRECGYQGLLFFAGRWSEFDGFLKALKECGNNMPSHLVADDSVNRYMANPGLRASAPSNLPIVYVSKAALATCGALRRASDQDDDVRASFLTWIRSGDLLSPPRCREGEDAPVGERVSLAYDAAMMLVRAAESLAARLRHADPQRQWDPTVLNPISVHTEVLRQNLEKAYPGVAGAISFGPDSGVPVAKRISLMRVARVTEVNTEPAEVFHCGAATPAESPDCRQP